MSFALGLGAASFVSVDERAGAERSGLIIIELLIKNRYNVRCDQLRDANHQVDPTKLSWHTGQWPLALIHRRCARIGWDKYF